MSNKLEDFVGRTVILAIFTMVLVQNMVGLAALVRTEEVLPTWPLILVSRVTSLIFVALIVVFTLVRLPVKTSAAGIEPRVTAIAGTFLMSALVMLPVGSASPEFQLVATVIIVAGTVLSAYCLFWLGRSFSLMASARKLVVAGPYSVVRHPLYAAEAVTFIGIVISNWSPAALALGVAQFGLQYRRILIEERVLRAAFPEYDAYSKDVPMLVPRRLSTR